MGRIPGICWIRTCAHYCHSPNLAEMSACHAGLVCCPSMEPMLGIWRAAAFGDAPAFPDAPELPSALRVSIACCKSPKPDGVLNELLLIPRHARHVVERGFLCLWRKAGGQVAVFIVGLGPKRRDAIDAIGRLLRIDYSGRIDSALRALGELCHDLPLGFEHSKHQHILALPEPCA